MRAAAKKEEESMSLSETPHNILTLPTKEMQESGITYFSYGIISSGEILVSYFTNEEWGNIYKEKCYNRADPLLKHVVHFHFPLIVWDALHPYGQEKQIMLERNEVCHLKSGLTVGINNKNNTEIIAFGTDVAPQEFYSLLKDETYKRNIYNIISAFYKKQEDTLSKALSKTSPLTQ